MSGTSDSGACRVSTLLFLAASARATLLNSRVARPLENVAGPFLISVDGKPGAP
jgi:hypothetical protein